MPTIRAGADYEAEDRLVLTEPARIKLLTDDTRLAICSLLRDRAHSIQQLSRLLAIPKGTVGHHVKLLEDSDLIRVVRTRPVRAVTEKFYGRTAWVFVVEPENPGDDRGFGAAGLRRAAAEMEAPSTVLNFGVVRARLRPVDQRRFEKRIQRMMRDFEAAEANDGEGEPCVLALSMYRRDVGA